MADSNMSDEDKAVHREANKIKADLDNDHGAQVPKGDEKSDTPPPKVDPFDARKVLFKKADAKRDAEARKVRDDNPSVEARVAAMEAEARGEDPNAPAPARKDAAPEGEGNDDPNAKNAQPSPEDLQAGRREVTLRYKGRLIKVAQTDIDRAGGQEAYLSSRYFEDSQAEEAARQAEFEERMRRLDEKAERLDRLREEAEQRNAAGHDAPAHGDGGTPSQGRNDPSAASAEDEYDTEELVAMLYSGDPVDAKTALERITRSSRQQQLDVEKLTDELAARLEKRLGPQTGDAAAEPASAPAQVDPRAEYTRQAVNRMAAEEYPDVVGNQDLAAQAYAEFQRLSVLPENADRTAVDVARDACEAIATKNRTDPRSEAREMKQGLPPAPTAGGAAPTGEEGEEVPTGSDFVEMMRRTRPGYSPMT